MCGIYFSCNSSSFRHPNSGLQQCLSRRGPDSCDVVTHTLQSGSELHQKDQADAKCFLVFSSTVLSLRGPTISRQPLVDPVTGSCLCWNGEAWAFGRDRITNDDTEAIFANLCKSLEGPRIAADVGEDDCPQVLSEFVRALNKIVGPYAFVFFDALSQRVMFGGDLLGRRSLLYTQEDTHSITVSSVSDPENTSIWNEIEAGDVYIYDIFKDDKSRFRKISSFLKDLRKSETVSIDRLPDFNRTEPLRLPPNLTTSSSSVRDLAIHLRKACQCRAENIPVPSSQSPALAILFSGGVDCTILARVIHDAVPCEQEIDLLNVAFENPRTLRAAIQNGYILSDERSPYALCPDRHTGLASFKELQRICPERVWRFVCVDVPFTEMIEHRERIKSLIKPQNTEMDLSIACALYFAARGKGKTLDLQCGRDTAYQTPARVLISGLGADELFGGYTRHATAFERQGYPGLLDELERDIRRIGKRNLGRDDRVIAHWGKEVRYPFLDEDLLAWALKLPVWEKCGFGDRQSVTQDHAATETHDQEQGKPVGLILEPGKKILRLLAFKMGLQNAAAEKKRAIQFGARTAKMETGNTKGTQVIS